MAHNGWYEEENENALTSSIREFGTRAMHGAVPTSNTEHVISQGINTLVGLATGSPVNPIVQTMVRAGVGLLMTPSPQPPSERRASEYQSTPRPTTWGTIRNTDDVSPQTTKSYLYKPPGSQRLNELRKW